MEVWVPFMTPTELTADRIMFEVEKVIQSNREWLLNAPMEILFVHAPVPAGGGSVTLQRAGGSLEEYLKSRKTIIQIKEAPNNTCCARAIIIGQFYVEEKSSMVRSFKRYVGRLTPYVVAFHKAAGVPLGTVCGPYEWQKIQNALGKLYDLVVISRDYFNTIIFRGNPLGKKIVCIYHANRHFHTITSLQGFLGRSYLCRLCLKPYDHAGDHV